MPAHQPRLSFTETEDGEAETDLCRAACYRWRTASELPGLLAALTEPPYADPHVRWCGRGGRVTAPPMPIVSIDSAALVRVFVELNKEGAEEHGGMLGLVISNVASNVEAMGHLKL